MTEDLKLEEDNVILWNREQYLRSTDEAQTISEHYFVIFYMDSRSLHIVHFHFLIIFCYFDPFILHTQAN